MIDLNNTARYNAYTMRERLQLHQASLLKLQQELDNIEAFFREFILPNLDPIQDIDMAEIDYGLASYQLDKIIRYTLPNKLKVVK